MSEPPSGTKLGSMRKTSEDQDLGLAILAQLYKLSHPLEVPPQGLSSAEFQVMEIQTVGRTDDYFFRTMLYSVASCYSVYVCIFK